MQSNFCTGSKNLDRHKTFWELGHVKGQGISGSLDSFLLFLKTKLTYHILLRTEKNQTFTSKRKLTFILTINTHFYEGRRQYFQYKSKFVRNGLNSMNSGTSSTNFRKGSIIESLFSFFI